MGAAPGGVYNGVAPGRDSRVAVARPGRSRGDAWGLPARHVGRARRGGGAARARERDSIPFPPNPTPHSTSGLVTPTAQPALIGAGATATRPAHAAAASRGPASDPGHAGRPTDTGLRVTRPTATLSDVTDGTPCSP